MLGRVLAAFLRCDLPLKVPLLSLDLFSRGCIFSFQNFKSCDSNDRNENIAIPIELPELFDTVFFV